MKKISNEYLMTALLRKSYHENWTNASTKTTNYIIFYALCNWRRAGRRKQCYCNWFLKLWQKCNFDSKAEEALLLVKICFWYISMPPPSQSLFLMRDFDCCCCCFSLPSTSLELCVSECDVPLATTRLLFRSLAVAADVVMAGTFCGSLV